MMFFMFHVHISKPTNGILIYNQQPSPFHQGHTQKKPSSPKAFLRPRHIQPEIWSYPRNTSWHQSPPPGAKELGNHTGRTCRLKWHADETYQRVGFFKWIFKSTLKQNIYIPKEEEETLPRCLSQVWTKYQWLFSNRNTWICMYVNMYNI